MAYEGYHSPSVSQAIDDDDDGTPVPFPSYPAEPRDVRPRAGSASRTDAYRPDSTRFPPKSAPINEAVTSAFDQANTSSYGVPPDLVAQITEDVIKRLQSAGLDNSTRPPPTIKRTSSGSTSPSMPSRAVYTPPSPKVENSAPNHGQPMPLGPESPKLAQSYREFAAADGDRGLPSPTKADPKTQRSSRMFANVEETTLDKIWGTLFDAEGRPLERLDQLLRGLAIHIIEDFKPRRGIVITPSKMKSFYDKFKIPNETYSWNKFFESSPEILSQMYCDLACQHHLIQGASKHDVKPTVPGLTPTGFSQWMTILILAHPDEEVERLQKAIMNLPIDNPDATKEQERFPKTVSRHLFPKLEDRREKSRFKRAAKVEDDHGLLPEKFGRSGSTSESKPAGGNRERTASIERERQPYSSRKDSVSDERPSISIERERKPYSAQPGGGKSHEDGKNEYSRPERANSTTRPGSEYMPIPENRGHHRTSSNANPPPRRHSPISQDFRRSDSDVSGFPPDMNDDQRRRMREAEQGRKDWARRAAEDDYNGRERDKYMPHDVGSPPNRGPNHDMGRSFEEDYYRSSPKPPGGYDYSQGYPPPYR